MPVNLFGYEWSFRFPAFNRQEAYVVRGLTDVQRKELAASLRVIVEQLEESGRD